MHVASIWKKNARKKLNIHDWHILFLLSVSWSQNTQLVRKPISTSCFIWWHYTPNQESWAETTRASYFTFLDSGRVTQVSHNIACFLSSPFKFLKEINTKIQKYKSAYQSKNKERKKIHTYSNILLAGKVICQMEDSFLFSEHWSYVAIS